MRGVEEHAVDEIVETEFRQIVDAHHRCANGQQTIGRSLFEGLGKRVLHIVHKQDALQETRLCHEEEAAAQLRIDAIGKEIRANAVVEKVLHHDAQEFPRGCNDPHHENKTHQERGSHDIVVAQAVRHGIAGYSLDCHRAMGGRSFL